MRLKFETDEINGLLLAVAEYTRNDGKIERIIAEGATISEAVRALVARFKDLQDAACEEMHRYGLITVERLAKEEAS